MALQIDKILERGVVAHECYTRIVGSSFEKSMVPGIIDGINVNVAFYFNGAARDADEHNAIQYKVYITEDKTKETRSLQYEWLKTLPDFAGAIDV